MAQLIPITGRVTELSNSHFAQNWTNYGSVHIREDDGRVTQVRLAIVTSEMPNALAVGTRGTFYFRKMHLLGSTRQLLAACEIDGQLRTASVTKGAITFGIITLVSILFIPLLVGLIAFPLCLATAISYARTQSQISALRLNPSSGVEVLRVRTI
ncbi:hypothetical protein Sa4125_15380 [Aureimonas sp. SA4125]|uniref:hypothetical protein n=1 Tax=Aureimonas sp. SA4125 TaxID=2826993 RepID=UPI001CC66A37|nr:hypothetical protein [Aureimonas sp. SA4125]BDA83996.1 hypothetical protein Sa4125_15380 [Aureimonas sp. SA4125]